MSFDKTCRPSGRPCACVRGEAKFCSGGGARYPIKAPSVDEVFNCLEPAEGSEADPEPMPANPKAIHGAAKPNLALIPAGASLKIAPVFALGAAKYGAYNWRKDAVEAETYMAAAMRHMAAWFDGEDIDEESGQPHIAHAAACMMILLDADVCYKLIDNRPHAGGAAQLVRDMTKPIEGQHSDRAGLKLKASPQRRPRLPG